MAPDRLTRANHPAFHYQDMLSDRPRMRAYREAIARSVSPGTVVADLGTGMGVLAVMAAQAGASRVHAIERRPDVAAIARRVARDNGVADVVRVWEGDARDVDVGEPVDLVVNELIGDFGLDEGIHETVRRFSERHLAEGGAVVPNEMALTLAPVTYPHDYLGVYVRDHHGVDLRAGNDQPCVAEADVQRLRHPPLPLAPIAPIERIAFDGAMPPRDPVLPFAFTVETSGSLQGFVGGFTATLVPGITLATDDADPTNHWDPWHWPVMPPRDLVAGQRIRGSLHAPGDRLSLAWTLDYEVED